MSSEQLPGVVQETKPRPQTRPSLVRGWSSPAWDISCRQPPAAASDDDDRESVASTARHSVSSRRGMPSLFNSYAGNFGRRSTMGPTSSVGVFSANAPVFDAELLQRWESEHARTSTQSAGSVGESSLVISSSPTKSYNIPFVEFSWLRRLRRKWKHFSLFGISSDPRPHIWGTRIKTDGRASKKSVDAIQRIVRDHESDGEMSLMLRDTRIKFSYFDLFETDRGTENTHMIRCFSRGANYLELVKIALAIEALGIAVLLICFWQVDPSKLFPPYELCLVDFIFDIFYLLCIVLELRTTILDHERGVEICNPRTILWRYFSSPFFWCEVMSLLVPAFLIRRLRELGLADGVVRPLVLVRVLRGWGVFHKPTKHRFIPNQLFIFSRLLGACLLFGHVLACVWYWFVFELLGTRTAGDLHLAPNSVGPANLVDYYGYSFNEGIYLLLAIDRQGKSTAEHLFLAFVLPFAALFHAYIFGEIFLVIQRMSALESRNQEHTLAVNEAMKVLGLSPALQLRIISYFTYERLHRNAHAFEELFRLLSPQLRFELHLYLYTDLIANTGLFRKSKPRIIREMVTLLNDIIFLPGDYVVRFGEHGDSMYFIISGKCAVLASDNETILSILERGSYFGEIALLTGVRRTAFVRSDVFCVLAQLTKSAFEPIIREFPEEIDILVGEIINVAEREKVREEAFRYYGIRGGGGTTRASMASAWAVTSSQSATDKRYSVPASAVDALHGEGRLRVPSTMFRRGSNLSNLTFNVQTSLSEAQQDPPSANDPTPNAGDIIVLSSPSPTKPPQVVVASETVEEFQPGDSDPMRRASDIGTRISDGGGRSSVQSSATLTEDVFQEKALPTEPARRSSSVRAWATLPGRALMSRLSMTKRMSLGSIGKSASISKNSEYSSVVPSQEAVVMDNKVVEEMRALRQQLTELMSRVVEIPSFLQDHQVHFAQAMAGAKESVVEDLWDRFGNMPIDIHELTLAFHDVVRMELGEDMNA
eukprot:GEMP01003302.1.p1 GENE.GEMP01003302.1~~GEMP01003302.1.p1  ORF type:complete len:993 (+),score=149.42 GEMP01003302.1:221-3199(+)